MTKKHRCTAAFHRSRIAVVIIVPAFARVNLSVRSSPGLPSDRAAYAPYCSPPTDLECVLGLILASDWSQPRRCLRVLDCDWPIALSVTRDDASQPRSVVSLRSPFSRRWSEPPVGPGPRMFPSGSAAFI